MQQSKKQTVTSIINSKGNKKLSMITAYDALFSNLFDGEVDFILVGDSLNMSFALSFTSALPYLFSSQHNI